MLIKSADPVQCLFKKCKLPLNFVYLLFSFSIATAYANITKLEYDLKAAVQVGTRTVVLDSENTLGTLEGVDAEVIVREENDEKLEALAASGTTVIAVGENGLILRSGDSGETWSEATGAPVFFGSFMSVVSGNANQWIAVGNDGNATDGVIYESTDDGESWSEIDRLLETPLSDVIWTGTRWLACGYDLFSDEGVIYGAADNDLASWSAVTFPSIGFTLSPFLALGYDGSNVIAVGDQGEILVSEDDGLTFSLIDYGLFPEFSERLNAVAVDSNGVFYLASLENRVLQFDGTTLSFFSPQEDNAPEILDLVLINDVPVAVGNFGATIELEVERTIPLDLLISVGGTQDFVLTISETLTTKTYTLETSVDLNADNWELLTSSTQTGTGGEMTFDVSINGDRRFWRAIESDL